MQEQLIKGAVMIDNLQNTETNARLINLEKHQATTYTQMENHQKTLDKLDSNMDTVSNICNEMKIMISLHNASLVDLRAASNSQGDELDTKFLTSLDGMHKLQLRNAENSTINREYTSSKIEELEKKLDNKSAQEDTLMSNRVRKLEEFKWKLIGIVTIVPAVVAFIPKLVGLV